MSPVSSSTLTCASARWRSASRSSSKLGRRGRLGGAHSASPPPPRRPRLRSARSARCGLLGHRLDVDEAGPRLHDARRAAGSPCAAGGPRTPPAGRGAGGSGGRRSATPYISQHSRSCQSAPGVHGHPATSTRGLGLVDVGLERDAPVLARWTARARTPGTDPPSRRRRTSSRSGCTGDDVSLPPSSPPSLGAGAQSMPEMNER